MSLRDARQKARNYYADSDRRLESDLLAFTSSERGIVIFTPRLVVLMKAVDSRDEPQLWMDGPDAATPNSWYVHLLAGDLRLAFCWARGLPPLPFFCFQRGLRGERVHILPWRRLPSPATGIHPERANLQHNH